MAEVRTAMIEFHPGLILILGGLLVSFLPNRPRQVVMVVAPLLAIAAALSIESGMMRTLPFINGMELVWLKADALSLGFAFIFSVMALLGNVYSLHINHAGESAAAMFYAGGSIGAVLAGDWLTLIFFWESLAISSVFLIWNKKDARAIAAGFRYILVHMMGGNLLLAGIFLKISGGSFTVAALTTAVPDTAYWLILLGVSINAAIPPLHAWLTDAYPEATITGSVFMCSYTSKVAVYALIRLFPGSQLLIWVGVIMAIYGVIFAVLENDIRRLLSYHIISQVGFMVAGAGIGTEMAINGAVALAFSNIIYKSLLFMGAGAVIDATGRRKLTQLGGLYRKMPLVAMFFGIGAFSISGVPFTAGFVSKALELNAAAANGMPTVELLLYLAGIGTFLSIAFKLNYLMFYGPDNGIEVKEIPKNMYVAMAGGAFLCILYGVLPNLLYSRLPFAVDYAPYTLDHVISTLQLMLGAFVVFWVLLPKLHTHDVISIDTDWFYRKPFAVFVDATVKLVCAIRDWFGERGWDTLHKMTPLFANPLKWAYQHGVEPEAQSPAPAVYQEDKYRFPVGLTVLLTVVMFVVTAAYIWV